MSVESKVRESLKSVEDPEMKISVIELGLISQAWTCFALLIIGIVFGVQLIAIALRVKKVLERVDTISDVSGWLSLLRKWPSRKKNDQWNHLKCPVQIH